MKTNIMRIISIILTIVFLCHFSNKKQEIKTQKATLKITITNIKKIKGNLLVAVFDDESKFLKDFNLAKGKKISANTHEFVFKDLSLGIYAVSVFQDANKNNSLDTNFLGIPKEPYGFSNNPSTLFGPPNFEKASFQINSNSTEVTIEL